MNDSVSDKRNQKQETSVQQRSTGDGVCGNRGVALSVNGSVALLTVPLTFVLAPVAGATALLLAAVVGCGTTGLTGVPGAPDATLEPDVDGEPLDTESRHDPRDADAVDVGGDPAEDVPVSRPHWYLTIGDTGDEEITGVAERGDGSIVLVGRTSHGSSISSPWIVTLDGAGRVLDQKVIEGWGPRDITVVSLADGAVLIAGTTSMSGAGRSDTWLARMEPHGEISWQKTIGGSRGEDYPSVSAAADGGFIVSALSETFSRGLTMEPGPWIVRFGPDATVRWQFTSMWPVSNGSGHLVERADGGIYYVASAVYDTAWEYRPWILSLDAAGLLEWERRLADSCISHTRALVSTEDGLVIVGSETTSSSGVVKVSREGDVVWERRMEVGIRGIVRRADGGYLIAGYLPALPPEGDYPMWIASLAGDGTLAWQRQMAKPGMPAWANVLALHEDGLVVAGCINPDPSDVRPTPNDAAILRLGVDGAFAAPCPYVREGGVEPEEGPTGSVGMFAEYGGAEGVVMEAAVTFTDIDVPHELICPE